MLLAITHIPELHEFMPLLQAIVNSGPNTPEVTEFGQWFVGLLKSFSTLSFDTQVQVSSIVGAQQGHARESFSSTLYRNNHVWPSF